MTFAILRLKDPDCTLFESAKLLLKNLVAKGLAALLKENLSMHLTSYTQGQKDTPTCY